MNTPKDLLYIEIEIPVAEEGEEIDLIDYFNEQIRDSDGDLGGELLQAFDLDVPNARGETDDVEIDDVTVDGKEVSVSYTQTWSATYPCDDLNRLGQQYGTVTGTEKDGKWLFEPHVRSEPRSTLDEF